MEYKTKGVVSLILSLIAFILIQIGSISFSFYDSFIRYFELVLSIVFYSFLCLTIYYFSNAYPEKKKKMTLLIVVPIFIAQLVFTIFSWWNWEFPYTGYISWFSSFVIFLVGSLSIAHFSKFLVKIRYSFLGFFNLFILFFIFNIILDKTRYLNNLHNIMKMVVDHTIVSFFMIVSHISLVILLIANLYFNKKATEETKKKRIVVYLVPVILFIILLIIVLVIFPLIDYFRVTQTGRAIKICSWFCQSTDNNFCNLKIRLESGVRGTCRELVDNYPRLNFPKCTEKIC